MGNFYRVTRKSINMQNGQFLQCMQTLNINVYSGFSYIIGPSTKFGKYFASFFGVPYLSIVTVDNMTFGGDWRPYKLHISIKTS